MIRLAAVMHQISFQLSLEITQQVPMNAANSIIGDLHA